MLTSHEHTGAGDCGCGSGGAAHGGGEALAALDRPRWFARQIVGPDDLTQEQDYHRARMRRHNRMLHGWGVVCGLRVRAGEQPCEIVVEAGYALDPCGEEIVVPDHVSLDACSQDIDGSPVSPCGGDPWCGSVKVERDPEQTYYLAIRYAEASARPVLAYGGGCAGDEPTCEFSRRRDSFELRLLDTLPPGHDKITPAADFVAALTCLRGARTCPSCPEATWVVLADVKIRRDTVDVECFPHRRYAVSHADLFFGCAPGTPDGLTKTQFAFAAAGSTVLADETAGETAEPAKASVAVKLPVAGLRTLPVNFEVERGETYRDLTAREGGRTFVADSGERFTLADAYAVAGVDPGATLDSAADALRPLEALELRLGDLQVTRQAFDELLDEHGIARLAREHGNAPARVLDLPAVDLTGVSPTSRLGRRLSELTVGAVAETGREDFLEQVTEGATGTARSRLRTQAGDVWATADRLRRLASDWRPA